MAAEPQSEFEQLEREVADLHQRALVADSNEQLEAVLEQMRPINERLRERDDSLSESELIPQLDAVVPDNLLPAAATVPDENMAALYEWVRSPCDLELVYDIPSAEEIAGMSAGAVADLLVTVDDCYAVVRALSPRQRRRLPLELAAKRRRLRRERKGTHDPKRRAEICTQQGRLAQTLAALHPGSRVRPAERRPSRLLSRTQPAVTQPRVPRRVCDRETRPRTRRLKAATRAGGCRAGPGDESSGESEPPPPSAASPYTLERHYALHAHLTPHERLLAFDGLPQFMRGEAWRRLLGDVERQRANCRYCGDPLDRGAEFCEPCAALRAGYRLTLVNALAMLALLEGERQ